MVVKTLQQQRFLPADCAEEYGWAFEYLLKIFSSINRIINTRGNEADTKGNSLKKS